jgi:uncharacterized protein YdeI (YjbR/CyaY-like superfamily)
MPAKAAGETAIKIRHSPMEHPRHQYPHETAALQEIARSCGLVEKIKWGKPCYTLAGKNIVLLQRFNDYLALMFFKGALLKDPEQLLFRIGEHMQAPRQLRFRNVADVTRLQPTIKAYIEEAMELERSGAKVARKKATEYEIPEELEARLQTDATLKEAFSALSPGRQKGYLFQIAAAKQSSTRVARIEKFRPRILAGKGIYD